MDELAALVATRIAEHGPQRFDVVQDLALSHPTLGFFSRGGGAGRVGRDFLTAPETGLLFGAVVARFLDAEWRRLGEPDPFVVIEAGAGRGSLALAVLRAAPACSAALRYVCVERSPALRAEAERRLPVESPETAFAVPRDVDDPRPLPTGPIVVTLPDLPGEAVRGVVLANELLDNLPVRLAQRIDGRWWELVVTGDATRFALDEVPLDARLARRLDHLVPDAPEAAIVPVHEAAAAWVGAALGLLDAGSLVAIDYGVARTAELAQRPWTEWLRTYRGHGRGRGVLADLGEQDITCEIAFDQLPTPDAIATQAEWLAAHGIDALVDEGRRIWAERAHLGDLTALAARSRVREAEALCDPAGMGAFWVATWRVR